MSRNSGSSPKSRSAAPGGPTVSRGLVGALFAVALLAAVSLAEAQAGSEDLGRFPGLARIFRDVTSRLSAPSPEQEAAAQFDFEQVVLAVSGQVASPAGRSLKDYRDGFNGVSPLALATSPGAVGRDDTAYRLHSLGYSAKEISDVIAGRITRAALDNAQKMLMLGTRPERVSDYLDREYRRLRTMRERAEAERRPPSEARPERTPPSASRAAEALADRYAVLHGVDPALVRAVIASESGWDQDAVSKVGAIGLMQLMPGTARELGVDPHDLRQNIEGGTRLLAGLLRAFKTVERALIAYNAGPGFADRYARGQVALYGETREFLSNVLGRLSGSRR